MSSTTEADEALPIIHAATGESVKASLGLTDDAKFVAIDGGLAVPITGQTSWMKPGRQLVFVGADTSSGQWFDVRVEGTASTASPAELNVDLTPPSASFTIDGPRHVNDQGLWLSPESTIRADFVDPSGISSSIMLVDGEASGSTITGLAEGSHHIVARGTDGAGNQGEGANQQVRIDHQGPLIEWHIADQGMPAADGGLIYQGPVSLTITARDDGAGLSRLNAAGHDGQISSGDQLSVTADQLIIEAMDHLGNVSRTTAAWRYDIEPPVLSVEIGDVDQPTDQVVRLSAGGRLNLRAEDHGVGVDSAEYRVNGREWLPLSETVQFVDRGWYQLEIRARDRVGQKAHAYWDVRTGNPRGLRPRNRELIDEDY